MKVAKLKRGATKGDVQNALGVVSNRQIRTYAWDALETWHFPTDAGYSSIIFTNGILSDIKEQKTLLTFARDKSTLISQQDIQIHQTISAVQLGWTVEQVDLLPLKPTRRFSEEETAELLLLLRRATVALRNSPMLLGLDLSVLSRNIVGQLYAYQGERLSASLIIFDGKVSEISFSEAPTKSQEIEIEQSLQ